MDHEAPCEEKTVPLEPKTPTANVPDSISPVDSDSSLSEEEIITDGNRGIISSSPPLYNQYSDKIRTDSNPFDCVFSSDEEIIESIYQNLLRVIISFQVQANSNSVAAAEIWWFDGCKTPPSRQPESKMVPDTCPGAPMKLTKISRNIDSGLRRKLF